MKWQIDSEGLTSFLLDLLRIPSPTGFTEEAIAFVAQALAAVDGAPWDMRRTAKGGLLLSWAGEEDLSPRGLTAHVDTLGAMVKEIKENGRLRLTLLGSYGWQSIEGETCLIHAAGGKTVSGTILPTKASVHIFGAEAREMQREEATMEVRLDLRTYSAAETEAAGIAVGDFVSLSPRAALTATRFVRSRHLDDKAGVAAIVAALRALHVAGLRPARRIWVLFSNYEEVGHGASAGFPADLAELLAVDMGAVGPGQVSDEFSVSICAKDSGGPYHWGLRQKLLQLAQANDIPYRVDVYPHYGSDGEAAWRAGYDVAVGLIGPGVDASHHYERTHVEALVATANLIAAYVLAP